MILSHKFAADHGIKPAPKPDPLLMEF